MVDAKKGGVKCFKLTLIYHYKHWPTPVNFADSLTKAQENQLRLQALRDEYVRSQRRAR